MSIRAPLKMALLGKAKTPGFNCAGDVVSRSNKQVNFDSNIENPGSKSLRLLSTGHDEQNFVPHQDCPHRL